MKRLRLRGDWSDTGPNARPDHQATTGERATEANEATEPQAASQSDEEVGDQPRRRGPPVNMNLMQRMTDALSRMLNDPSTRMAMRNLSEREREPTEEPAMGRTINDIQESISDMREEYIDRHNAEPGVSLRYGSQGVESSSISIDRNPQESSSAAGAAGGGSTSGTNLFLPGPRQVTTSHGVPGTNPVTGQRQRRQGVSGPPSGVLLSLTFMFLILA